MTDDRIKEIFKEKTWENYGQHVLVFARAIEREVQATCATPTDQDTIDARRYRYLKSIAHLTDFDGGNCGAWNIRGIKAYDNWLDNQYDFETFEGAVDAAMKSEGIK